MWIIWNYQDKTLQAKTLFHASVNFSSVSSVSFIECLIKWTQNTPISFTVFTFYEIVLVDCNYSTISKAAFSKFFFLLHFAINLQLRSPDFKVLFISIFQKDSFISNTFNKYKYLLCDWLYTIFNINSEFIQPTEEVWW